MKKLILLALISLLSLPSKAQQHDANLYKVIKAMENGKWDFSPAAYFLLLHKDYSGAKAQWRFHGIIPYIKTTFSEKRSDTGRVYPIRTKSLLVDEDKGLAVQDYGKQVKAMFQEEETAAADRNLDVVYNNYASDFEKKNRVVVELLEFIAAESKGRLAKNITDLSQELNRINEGIAYIHKKGVGYELENIKREKSYIVFNKQLDLLIKRARHLALLADNLY